MVWAKVRDGSPGGKSETTRRGFVKEVGFKPRVKDRGSYGWAVWWIKEEEVMGEGIGESQTEELVPEWGRRRDKGSWF